MVVDRQDSIVEDDYYDEEEYSDDGRDDHDDEDETDVCDEDGYEDEDEEDEDEDDVEDEYHVEDEDDVEDDETPTPVLSYEDDSWSQPSAGIQTARRLSITGHSVEPSAPPERELWELEDPTIMVSIMDHFVPPPLPQQEQQQQQLGDDDEEEEQDDKNLWLSSPLEVTPKIHESSRITDHLVPQPQQQKQGEKKKKNKQDSKNSWPSSPMEGAPKVERPQIVPQLRQQKRGEKKKHDSRKPWPSSPLEEAPKLKSSQIMEHFVPQQGENKEHGDRNLWLSSALEDVMASKLGSPRAGGVKQSPTMDGPTDGTVLSALTAASDATTSKIMAALVRHVAGLEDYGNDMPGNGHNSFSSSTDEGGEATVELKQRFQYIDSLLNDELGSASVTSLRDIIPVAAPSVGKLQQQTKRNHYPRSDQGTQSGNPHHQQQQRIITIREIPHDDSSVRSFSRRGADDDGISTTRSFMIVEDTPDASSSSTASCQIYSSVWSSGVAGAFLGTLLVGTIPGVIAGLYAAHVHDDEGPAGDISRALGEIATLIRHKVLLIEARHNVTSKAQIAIKQAFALAMELNRRHQIAFKMHRFAQFAWKMTLDYVTQKGREIQYRTADLAFTVEPKQMEPTKQMMVEPTGMLVVAPVSNRAVQ